MRVCKTFRWSAGHKLNLPYASPCTNQHGHDYLIGVYLEGPLNENGMVMDFSELKRLVEKTSFDHKNLNDIMAVNPTAENLVLFLKDFLDNVWSKDYPKLVKIRVWETPTSFAEEVW